MLMFLLALFKGRYCGVLQRTGIVIILFYSFFIQINNTALSLILIPADRVTGLGY
jgi:uncharacterized YccA/Bax inhibitor family protein